jgi:hypothetical protein
LESIDGKSLAREIIAVEDVLVYDWLTEHRVTESIIVVKEATDALKLLASGKHDCAVLNRLHGLDLLKDIEISNLETFGPPVLVTPALQKPEGFRAKAPRVKP